MVTDRWMSSFLAKRFQKFSLVDSIHVVEEISKLSFDSKSRWLFSLLTLSLSINGKILFYAKFTDSWRARHAYEWVWNFPSTTTTKFPRFSSTTNTTTFLLFFTHRHHLHHHLHQICIVFLSPPPLLFCFPIIVTTTASFLLFFLATTTTTTTFILFSPLCDHHYHILLGSLSNNDGDGYKHVT